MVIYILPCGFYRKARFIEMKRDLIGLRIKYFRAERNLTQEKLAELIDTSCRHIVNIETGRKCPSLSLLVRIANVLNVTADDLLIDNLSHSGGRTDFDVSILMLDCNDTEKAILTKALKNLKALLSEYGI